MLRLVLGYVCVYIYIYIYVCVCLCMTPPPFKRLWQHSDAPRLPHMKPTLILRLVVGHVRVRVWYIHICAYLCMCACVYVCDAYTIQDFVAHDDTPLLPYMKPKLMTWLVAGYVCACVACLYVFMNHKYICTTRSREWMLQVKWQIWLNMLHSRNPQNQSTDITRYKFKFKWGFYRNVIPMRWDCGKNPILNSVYLTIAICEEGHCDGKMRWDPVR